MVLIFIINNTLNTLMSFNIDRQKVRRFVGENSGIMQVDGERRILIDGATCCLRS